MKKLSLAIILTLVLFLLTGCANRLVIKNADIKEVIPQFKEFVALHGYNLTYANDQTGAYRVELGQVYIPYQSETTRQSASFATENIHTYPQANTYEESTWRTVQARDRYVLVAVMVRITASGSDVVLQMDSTESVGPSVSQVNLLRKFFRELGYQADFE
jgi:hypothetical protein